MSSISISALVFFVVLGTSAQALARSESLSWRHSSPADLESFCLYGVDAPSSRQDGSCLEISRGDALQPESGFFSYEWQGLGDSQRWFCVTALDSQGRESNCSNWRYRPASAPPPPASPCGSDVDERFCADFESTEIGFPPDGWVTSEAQRMFWQEPHFVVGEIAIAGQTQRVMTSPESPLAIQSHYVLGGSEHWRDYQLRGRLMTQEQFGGIGVTLYAQAPDNDHFYRLIRQGSSGAFRIDPNPRNRPLSCLEPSTGVVPEAGVWYQVRFEVRTGADSTLLRASVWRDGELEPEAWQAVCDDRDSRRLEGGAIGLWNDGAGNKFWDDLRAINLENQPLGRPGTPHLVTP